MYLFSRTSTNCLKRLVSLIYNLLEADFTYLVGLHVENKCTLYVLVSLQDGGHCTTIGCYNHSITGLHTLDLLNTCMPLFIFRGR